MIYGLVLASGLSRRMGRDKLLLPWHGRPLLEHVLTNVAQAPLDEVLVVISIERMEYLNKATTYKYLPILNPGPSLGIGTSLALGIRHLPHTAEAVVVLLGDQPEMDADDIVQIIKLYDQHRGNKIIIQTEYQNRKIGHPIIFSKHFFNDLGYLSEDVGGRKIIQDNPGDVVYYHSRNAYPNDIDTVEDYEILLSKERRPSL